ncbi:catalase family peroxidase [Glaciecola sp. SC05]|uniref:catalase family peroxidase n=1 Tax=Glaciecola sp. SC05 TaxID=1987355 RepID=UPI003529917D
MKKRQEKAANLRFKSKIPEKQARLIGFIIVLPVFFFLFYKIFAYVDRNTVSAQQFVDLQQGKIPHAGFRRAHAKGSCITGVFESNGALSTYTSATVLQTGTHPFVGRFSISGNDPSAPDLQSPVRSLALSMSDSGNSQNSEWRMAMNTPPVMPVATPEAFYAQLTAMAPDPETKQANPQRIQQFFKDHPETSAFLDWKQSYVPSNSFAAETYHSINAFYLLNKEGDKRAFRWRLEPSSAEQFPELDTAKPDALQAQLIEILSTGDIRFNFLVTLAEATDDENNPTILWPPERTSISAGQIVIQRHAEQGMCQDRNFDPLVLPQGVEPSADPILRARSAAYAESFRRRASDVLFEGGR